MTGKDWLTLGFSAAAFIVAFASFYYSHIHKRAGAVLVLLERDFSPEHLSFSDVKGEDGNFFCTGIHPQKRHLKYSLSNPGKQTLYVKNVEILQGPNNRGNLRSNASFAVVPGVSVDDFLIEPGEIKIIKIAHATNYDLGEGYDFEKNCYQLVSLELVSADGSRYQICHDITKLGPSGPNIHNPIWDGQTLGEAIRNTGFV